MSTTSTKGQLFKSSILEKLTHTHVAVPLTIFFGSSLFMLGREIYLGYFSLGNLLLVFLGGMFFWTLFEYLMHRYVFHIPRTSKAREKFQYTFHGVHHDHPRDKTRLAMPPVVSVVLATILFSIGYFSFGHQGLTFISGFIFMYASYLIIHYSTHAVAPPRNFLAVLWKHHGIHHMDEEVAFGVSSPFWDMVFGTMPRKK